MGFIDASTETSLSEMVMGGDMSFPRPWPYAIAIEEIIIVTSSSVSEAEYRFRMLYMAGASAK
ncbi:MAG TPA: hypothetical protein VKA40_09880 [Nitrososphaera sp.]|nr:hypothetical protein [Nitrososphaera sp.]